MVKWYHMCVQLGHGFHKQAKHFNSTTPPQHQNTTPVGFEPTRGDPIGLAGRRLSHSAKVSLDFAFFYRNKKGPSDTLFDKLDDLAEQGISGLVVEYIAAIDVTRARFPADACFAFRARIETIQD